MLNKNDKAMLDLLRERLCLRVNVKRDYDDQCSIRVTLFFKDDDGEIHEIDSDFDSLPESSR